MRIPLSSPLPLSLPLLSLSLSLPALFFLLRGPRCAPWSCEPAPCSPPASPLAPWERSRASKRAFEWGEARVACGKRLARPGPHREEGEEVFSELFSLPWDGAEAGECHRDSLLFVRSLFLSLLFRCQQWIFTGLP